MPTLKTPTSFMEPEKRVEKVYVSPDSSHTCWSGWCNSGGDFGKKILLTLVCVLLVYGIFLLGALIRNNLRKYDVIGLADRSERTISVVGIGKVTADNDTAVTTIGYTNTDKDSNVAREANKKVMDPLLQDLKAMGIAEADLQSNFNVNPNYVYTDGKGQEIKGYTVTNNVTVKVRDRSKVSAVLALAAKYGANQVGGINYNIDNTENLKAEARQKAIADAKMKARDLAQTLGVRVVALVSYNEFEGGIMSPVPYYAKSMDMVAGNAMATMSGPEVAAGSKDVEMNVNIVYEIVPIYQY